MTAPMKCTPTEATRLVSLKTRKRGPKLTPEREQELSDLRARAAEIEVLQKQQKQIAHDVMPEDDIWKEKREELFATGPGTVINMLKRNQNPAWKNFYMKYGFESAKDIEKFVRKEAIKRGLL